MRCVALESERAQRASKRGKQAQLHSKVAPAAANVHVAFGKQESRSKRAAAERDSQQLLLSKTGVAAAAAAATSIFARLFLSSQWAAPRRRPVTGYVCSGRDAYICVRAACYVHIYTYICVCVFVCMFLAFFRSAHDKQMPYTAQGLPKPKGAVPCQRGLPRCLFLQCVGAGVCVCVYALYTCQTFCGQNI